MKSSLLVMGCLVCASICALTLSNLYRASAQENPLEVVDINPDHSLEEQQNVEITKDLVQTFITGDRDFLLSHVASDVVWDVKGSPLIIQTAGRWIGVNGINKFLDTSSSLWTTQNFVADNIWADGDVVIVAGRQTDTAVSTGKQVVQNWIIVLTYNERLLTRAEFYGDGAAQYWSLVK
ncbi:nuclear transport factor 2 family protein [bacterium]|nr:nuclear transport factor 2 family protein [bacterium]